jgi:hypothetical protein
MDKGDKRGALSRGGTLAPSTTAGAGVGGTAPAGAGTPAPAELCFNVTEATFQKLVIDSEVPREPSLGYSVRGSYESGRVS